MITVARVTFVSSVVSSGGGGGGVFRAAWIDTGPAEGEIGPHPSFLRDLLMPPLLKLDHHSCKDVCQNWWGKINGFSKSGLQGHFYLCIMYVGL